ncbi:MAG: DUF420 domain-containing protein [Anaerolineae bacterium]
MSGLLGTRAPLTNDLVLIAQAVVAVLLIAGFWNVRRGRFDTHRRLMTSAFGLGILSTLTVMVPALLSDLPPDLGPLAAQLLPVARPGHATFGGLTLLSAFYLVVVMRNYPQPHPRRIGNFKRLMRVTIVAWLLSISGGAALYFLSYVA